MTTTKATILVVDDTPENINVLSGILKSQYRVKAALNGTIALKIAKASPKPDLILLDVMMPEIDGYEVCRQLKQDPETCDIPIIFVTAKSAVEDEEHGLSLGAVDYIIKPISPPLVLARIRTHLSLYDQARHLEKLVQTRTAELNDTRLEIIRRLGRAAEYKDNETGMHVIRMSEYTRLIAQRLSDDSSWVDLVYNAAPMHDIGKIGVPDNILLKPGKLEPQEWQTIQQHCRYGAEIIGEHASPLLTMAREVALFHHEKWNGTGYPHGLSGSDIPLSARIVAVADVFDALTSERPYKPAWPVDEAIELIKSDAGTHFDPELVEVFLACLPDILQIKEKHADK